MKLTTKLLGLALGLSLPLSIVSCKEAQKAATDAKDKVEATTAEGTDKVAEMVDTAKAKIEDTAADAKATVANTVTEAVAAVPTEGASKVLGQFENMNTALEAVTDLDTAKAAMPALATAGKMVKTGMAAVGGDEKMEAALEASPELKERFGKSMGALMGHMQRIKAASPEAYEFIDTKMDAIMK